jgi:uncharacterized protein
MEWLGYFAAICIGIVLGTLGGGGSILSIPILVYLFHLDVVTASAYSLFIVGMTSLVGAIPKYQEHLINLRTGIVFGVPSIVSIFSTRKWVVPSIPEVLSMGPFHITKRLLLLGIFAVLMILASYSMIRQREIVLQDVEKPRTVLLVLEGLLIGFLTGLVGAGGGFLIIPALILLTGLPFKTAVGTSLFIIAINSLLGFAGDLLNFSIHWTFLLTITALAVAGIFGGIYISRFVSQERMKQLFGWFVLITGVLILAKEMFFVEDAL